MRNLRWWRSALVVLVLGATIAPYGSAVADCPVESWVEEPLFVQNEKGPDGIGGSGMLPGDEGEEDGIGGSGIYGTVIGFGSLCLNGHRLIYDEDVVLTTDEASSTIEALAVGQVVLVDLGESADDLRARSIQIQHILVGPVTAFRDGYLEVMGERVLVDALSSEELEWIEIGIRVAISGLNGPRGRSIVSRIDLADADSPDLVRGELMLDENGHKWMIGTIRLETSVAGMSMSDLRGRQRLHGRWNEMSSRFEVAGAAASPMTLKMSRRVDVEGYVTGVSESEIQIGEVRFRIQDRSRGHIVEVGDRVRVRGQLDRDRKSFRVTSMVRLPGPLLLRSLDRSWHAPQWVPERLDDRRRQEIRDDRQQMRRHDRLPRHRIDRVRPQRPHRPRPRRDVIDGRDAVNRR